MQLHFTDTQCNYKHTIHFRNKRCTVRYKQYNVSARQLHTLLHEYYLHNIARVVQTDAAITRTHHWTPTQSAETTMKNITTGTKHINNKHSSNHREKHTNKQAYCTAYVAVHNTTRALYSDINRFQRNQHVRSIINALTTLVRSSVCFRLFQGDLQPLPHDLVAVHALYGTLSRCSIVITDKTWPRKESDGRKQILSTCHKSKHLPPHADYCIRNAQLQKKLCVRMCYLYTGKGPTKSFAEMSFLVHKHFGTNNIAIVTEKLDQVSIQIVRWKMVDEEVGSFRTWTKSQCKKQRRHFNTRAPRAFQTICTAM